MIYYDFRHEIQKQCINQINSTFGVEALSKTTVYHWFSEFNRGQSMFTDEFKEGHPKAFVVPQNNDSVRELIIQDNHVTNQVLKNKILYDLLGIDAKGKGRYSTFPIEANTTETLVVLTSCPFEVASA
ncbi:hypothetical protein EVAR_85986_1 [Eumeta japonica]|uniref:Mos1 transposase HTH domain-containing protein n=1 Tax=Eumeta variegata TaxID=151549 RepID=A0A4C1UKS4_EUMVA|nr:hypothetical protein EVAR_85986_1 [Eumeta japonica]